MHAIHHTEGVILAASDTGEADRMYTVYTKDHGKLAIFAKGVRHEKSKLRYHLRPCARLRLSFVEGKDILRLTDAEELEPPSAGEKEWHAAKRAALFANRLIAGRERDPGVWDVIASTFRALAAGASATPSFEREFQARLLHRLGYLAQEAADAALLREALAASQL